MGELDDFLEQGTQPADVTTEPHADEPKGPARDESGRFAPKQTGETPQETAEPVPPTEQKEQLPPETFKGLKDEREKRQNLERELQTLREQLQSLQKPAEPAPPPPSIWEDEQGFGDHITGQAVNQASLNARLDTSEMLAYQAHEDFDEMKAKFIEMMGLNPSLQQQALGSRHPWEKAYQIAKNAAKMEALGAVDVTDMEAKLREQITAELQAQAPTPAAPALPASLADTQSARGPGPGQPPAFEALFGPKR